MRSGWHDNAGAVISREFQSRRFALRPPAIKMGRPPLRHSVRFDSIRGRVYETQTTMILNDLFFNIRCMAVAQHKDHCASTASRTVRPVANIFRESLVPVRLKVRLVQVADVDAVVTEEPVGFQLPAANPVSVPISQPQGFFPVCPTGPCNHGGQRPLGHLLGDLSRLRGKRSLREDGESTKCRLG